MEIKSEVLKQEAVYICRRLLFFNLRFKMFYSSAGLPTMGARKMLIYNLSKKHSM